MQNTKTSLWTVSQMDGPCDFPFSLLMDKLFPLGQYKQTNLFWPEQASQTWLVYFPLFFPSVGKEKVYIQPKEKKARTKLCLLCVCSQSSRCLELSAQPSHSFPHQCAIVFIALHSPRIFFHLFCCSSILTSASSQMETIRLPLPAWMMEVQVKRKKKQILCCWWKLFRHSCFVLQDGCWEQGSVLIRMCRDCACIFKA